MENLMIQYALKSSLAMVLLYGLYVLVFKNDTFNKTKRFYLLFILFFSLLYPFCKLSISTTVNIPMYQAILPQIEITANNSTSDNQLFAIGWGNLLFFILITGSVFLFIKFLIQLSGIIKLRFKKKCQDIGNYKAISIDNSIAPFSFFHWIFVSPRSFQEEDLSVILKHEKVHADQYHSLDILFGELFCILFWWNPIVWLLKRDIKINLEYLADKGVLEEGIEPTKYQYLLLQVIKPSATIQIVNNFNVSQLKKRIIMINKKRTSGLMSFKYLLALPIIAMMLLGNAQKAFSQKIEMAYQNLPESSESAQDAEKPFVSVEIMPQFPGGESGLMKYISANLKYPEAAAKEKIEGRVVARFVVSKTGEVGDIKILRGIDPQCNEEVVRLVREMPTWTPGKQNGKDVDVYYTLPILYKLQKDFPQTTENKD